MVAKLGEICYICRYNCCKKYDGGLKTTWWDCQAAKGKICAIWLIWLMGLMGLIGLMGPISLIGLTGREGITECSGVLWVAIGG